MIFQIRDMVKNMFLFERRRKVQDVNVDERVDYSRKESNFQLA